ncbi:MAG: spermidine synthase-like protein [Polaromonas sp.]|nr:spermidine synthase-like protein [Polaromonas sp.]
MRATGVAAGSDGFVRPFLQDDGQALSLHFTPVELQSRMSKRNPWHLEVDYTRTMMGFLLLQPVPARLAMVGLGGGSLAKFCRRLLPDCHITAVENNPHVIALRHAFAIPDDDARFEVLLEDGAAFIARTLGTLDVLLVDGFDHGGQPAALCTQAFYDHCFATLAPDGVLAVNLHLDDADYPLWVDRILRSFGGNAVEVPAPEKSNCIVLASRGAVISPHRVNAKKVLASMEPEARQQLREEFARAVWTMKDLEGP